MNLARHYLSGEEIRPGDRILLASRSGQIVFVVGMSGAPDDAESWLEHHEGFMLDVEGLGLLFMSNSDEDLEFVTRGPADSHPFA